MPEVVITRSEVVVVDSVETNTYGDLLFKDKGGGSHKISNKRVQYFKETIVPGAAAQLNYAMAYNKEYIYSATKVEGSLPPPQKPVMPNLDEKTQQEIKKVSEPTMTPDKWAEKDRITRKSIERQTSLNAAIELAKVAIIKPDQIIASAKKFEAYLEGESTLVKEAKRLDEGG